LHDFIFSLTLNYKVLFITDMNKQQEQLDALNDIRTMMERSSRFISLSGLSGVIAGIAAVTGVVAAYVFLGMTVSESGYYRYVLNEEGTLNLPVVHFFLYSGIAILLVALLAAALLSARKAGKAGVPAWNSTSKRMLVNLGIPLFAGGVYCLIMLFHGLIALIAPATLLFYGLALLNASKYTLNDIRYLGVLQIVLGLLASFVIEYGLLFWVAGFGFLHIVYGIAMYLKYER
jgi:uncharacterized membrane protein YgdD (TMEM256/DUF423 family)